MLRLCCCLLNCSAGAPCYSDTYYNEAEGAETGLLRRTLRLCRYICVKKVREIIKKSGAFCIYADTYCNKAEGAETGLLRRTLRLCRYICEKNFGRLLKNRALSVAIHIVMKREMLKSDCRSHTALMQIYMRKKTSGDY